MTIEFTDNFESYADTAAFLAAYDAAANAVLNTTGGLGSSKGAGVVTGKQGYFGNAIADTNYLKAGFYVKFDNLPVSQGSFFSFDRATANGPNDTTTTHGGMKLLSDGTLTVVRSDALSTVNTSATLSADTWYYIEFAIHKSVTGAAIVWVNGVEVLNESGDYLESTGGATHSMFGRYDSTNGAMYFDEITVQSDATTMFTESEYVPPSGGGGDTVTGVGGGSVSFGTGVVLGTGVSRGMGVGG